MSFQELKIGCETGDLDTVKRAIASGATNPKEQNRTDRNLRDTPAHIACREGHLDVVKFLVEGQHCSLKDKNVEGLTPLHLAVRKGHLHIVKFLAEGNHCSLESTDKQGQTPLLIAIRNELEEIVEYLVSNPSVEIAYYKESDGSTLLHLACRKNWLTIAKALIEKRKIDANSTNGFYTTSLQIACREGNLDIVKYLIEVQGCSANRSDLSSQTPLHEACEGGHLDIVKYLVEGRLCGNIQAINRERQTPIYLALREKHKEVVKFLVEGNHCNLETVDKKGRTTLHLAVRDGDLDLVKFLVEGKYCNLEARDNDGQTPAHVAARVGHLDIVKWLTEESHCNIEATDKEGHSPLHLSASHGHHEILKYLVEVKGYSAKCVDKAKQTPLHHACWYGHLNITKFLVEGNHCCVQDKNNDGQTPLHLAVRLRHLDIVKFLVEGNHCNIEDRDNQDQTPLKIAIRNNDESVVECLVSNPDVDVTYEDVDGSTLIHFACRKKWLMVVIALIERRNFDANSTNSRGQTLLHQACQNEDGSMFEYLVSNPKVNLTYEGNDGSTLLHLACRKKWLSAANILIKKRNFDVNSTNSFGQTALHLACRSNHLDVATLLVSGTHCNPNFLTTNGESPLDLATSPDMIRLLLQNGAQPTYYNMDKCFPDQFQIDPTEMAVKVFVVGDPGAGKSTLVKSMESEAEGFSSRLKNQLTKVRNVDEKTAGIIPHEMNSKTLGRVTLYDFAGHREFYASHDAVLRNSNNSPSVIVLVVNMSDEESKIRETVEYWFEFLAQQRYEVGSKPHLLIVGSHVDEMSSSNVKSRSKYLQSIIDKSNLETFASTEQFMLDCRYAERSLMSKLRKRLSDLCQKLRPPEKLDFASHYLLVFMLDKFRNDAAITLTSVKQEVKKCTDVEVHWTWMKSLNLPASCEKLNEQGNIMLMKSSEGLERSWIILNKAVLLSQVNGKLFAPEKFKEHSMVATNTGVVALSRLISLFPDLNPNMITQFLCHLEFCHEIKDTKVLTLLQSDTETCSTTENFYFFPALVRRETPTDIWQHSEDFSYNTGWMIKCSKKEQFLTPRFLQVLLLRLAFNFALIPTETHSSIPIQRRCSVWKNGISWANQASGEAIIEVVDQKQVIVMTRSKHRKLESVNLRSLIIQTVLSTKSEFCPQVLIQESVFYPEDVVDYPINPNQAKSVSITDVALTVKEGKEFIVVDHNQTLELKKLLHFEAYSNWNEEILQKVFNQDNLEHHQEISIELILRIAEQTYINAEDYITACKLLPWQLSSSHTHPRDKLAQALQHWKEKMGIKGTPCCLHNTLDQFSVFAGRNPLKVAKGELSLALCCCSTMDQTEVVIQDQDVHKREAEKYQYADILERNSRPKLHELQLLNGYSGEKIRIMENVAPRWDTFAIPLGFCHSRIATIKRDNQFSTDAACQNMFSRWLNGEHDLKPATWETVIHCLTIIGLVDIARSLRNIMQ